uniref:Putative secreted peptide n=1 Tax=Anopheles braziliensis TaxID=58242 RepID=A0A2M3ZWV3_9DIPT
MLKIRSLLLMVWISSLSNSVSWLCIKSIKLVILISIELLMSGSIISKKDILMIVGILVEPSSRDSKLSTVTGSVSIDFIQSLDFTSLPLVKTE